ncbi:uncharacterized protein LOC143470362 isoform X1 [Clavelina lepadiformis]|uniref:uncharacterized protein LOC143470362 isoform X1 n=1 Tax=Clavelina lepadiformis TaxID=159417 RepID=UPI0040417343
MEGSSAGRQSPRFSYDACPVVLGALLGVLGFVALVKGEIVPTEITGAVIGLVVTCWVITSLLGYCLCTRISPQDVWRRLNRNTSETESGQDIGNIINTSDENLIRLIYGLANTRRVGSAENEVNPRDDDKPPDYDKLNFTPIVNIDSNSSTSTGSISNSGESSPPGYDEATQRS